MRKPTQLSEYVLRVGIGFFAIGFLVGIPSHLSGAVSVENGAMELAIVGIGVCVMAIAVLGFEE